MVLACGFATIGAGSASALPESCAEFQKLIAPRQAAIETINRFKQHKPTASEACKAMTALTAADKKIMDWMTANKDWCQIPEQQIAQLHQANDQSTAFKTKACTAAVTQAKQLEQLKRAQAEGAAPAPPGAGIRLPQGAL